MCERIGEATKLFLPMFLGAGVHAKERGVATRGLDVQDEPRERCDAP